MFDHLSSVAINEIGCLAIRNLACGNTKQLGWLKESGGVGAVIDALMEHEAIPSLAHAGCAALRNLAVDSWADEGRRGFVAAAGSAAAIVTSQGVPALVGAMRSHPTVAAVQMEGCCALRNLACGTPGDARSRQGAVEAIVEAGGIEVLLTALRTHERAPRVLAQGCGALRNLATSLEVRGVLVQGGGVEAAVGAMQTHAADEEVCEQACASLANLAQMPTRSGGMDVSAEAHRRHVSEAGAAIAAAIAASAHLGLAGALRHHSSSLEVTVGACTTMAILLNAAGHDPAPLVADLIRMQGALSALAAACVAFPETPSVVEHACACLCKVVTIGGDAAAHALSSTIEAPRDVLRALSHAEERRIVRPDAPGMREVHQALGRGRGSGRL